MAERATSSDGGGAYLVYNLFYFAAQLKTQDREGQMIKDVRDILANERTYLSWIRTSIAVMAFGFLVERFNLFLSYMGKSLGAGAMIHGQSSARRIGIGLIVMGIVAMLVSTVRYVMRDRDIKHTEQRQSLSLVPDVLLGVLLITLGILLTFYLLNIGA